MDEMMAALLRYEINAEIEENVFPTLANLRDWQSHMFLAAQFRRHLGRPPGSEVKERRTAYIGLKDHSKEPFHNLSRVKFRDILLHPGHKGKYVICRTVSLPTRVVAIEVNVEDPSGDVLPLTIHNSPLPLFVSAPELADIFPIGTLLAIREPYTNMSLLNASGPLSIRVDSPTDLTFIDNQSNLLQDIFWKFPSRGPPWRPQATALECKLDGNKKFKGKMLLSAAIAYTMGLSLSPSHDLSLDLRLNRSESYLKLGFFSAALADAQLVLSDKALQQHSIKLGKALLKAGKANYFQDKFKEALDCFMQLKTIPDGIAEAETWVNNAHLRISEQNNGDYDWYELFKNSQVAGSRLDVADYIGPIEVRNLGSCGNGRGMVASRDISPGELLLVCKPFVSVFPDEFPEKICVDSFNFMTGEVDRTFAVALQYNCIQKIFGNPSMRNLVYHLAPYAPLSDSYPPQTDSEMLHGPLHTSIDIDVSKVEHICSMNAFRLYPLGYPDSTSEGRPFADAPAALYLLPSIFNHSCYPNTFKFCIRDVMVIRATSQITKGDEIFLSYTEVRPYEERTERLERWEISCQCQLCQDDREEGPHARAERERLEASILGDPTMKPLHMEIRGLEMTIKHIEKTYLPNRRGVKISLACMHQLLGFLLEHLAISTHTPKHYYRAIAEEIQALKAFGMPVIDDSIKGKIHKKYRRQSAVDKQKLMGVLEPKLTIEIALSVVVNFFRLNDEIRAERWLRAAWLIHDITIGGGKTLFDERYKNIIAAGPYAEIITSIKK